MMIPNQFLFESFSFTVFANLNRVENVQCCTIFDKLKGVMERQGDTCCLQNKAISPSSVFDSGPAHQSKLWSWSAGNTGCRKHWERSRSGLAEERCIYFVGSEEPEHVCQVSTLIGEVSLTLSSVYRWLTLGQSNHTWEGFFIINISYLSFWSLEDQTRGRCCNTMLQIDLLFSPKTIKF